MRSAALFAVRFSLFGVRFLSLVLNLAASRASRRAPILFGCGGVEVTRAFACPETLHYTCRRTKKDAWAGKSKERITP